jgi:hypothetical protein
MLSFNRFFKSKSSSKETFNSTLKAFFENVRARQLKVLRELLKGTF